MDMADQDKFEPEKGNEEPIHYHSPNLSSEWQFTGANLTNTTLGLIPPMAICKGDLLESSSCSSASMVDSFCPPIWDQPTNSPNLGLCEINVQNSVRTSNTLAFRKGNLVPPRIAERTLDMGWTPLNSMPKEGLFLPVTTTPGLLPQSLSHCPTDSGFIERAARFSCFSGGNFGDMMNPFCITQSASPYSRAQEVFAGANGLNSLPCGQSQKNEMMTEGSKEVSLAVECGATEGSPLKNEAKQGVGVSGNDSDEVYFSSGRGGESQSPLDGTGGGSSAKGHSSKKRKRNGQDNEHDQAKGALKAEAKMDNTEIQQKGDQHPTLTTNRPTGKHVKEGTEAVKEEYIHVRARRGQATNSHSLAERVRREKISERMKFLQDLVPGCSKVTGKAVMLDEIINYVQSLQRQVEFLSMKLATVNPRLEFNIEELLTRDIHSRPGPSSSLGFPPDMTMPYPPPHPPQPPGLNQAGHPGMGNSSDALQRTINSHLTATSAGFKEPTSQVPNVWEDELHNIVQMGFNSSVPLDGQEVLCHQAI